MMTMVAGQVLRVKQGSKWEALALGALLALTGLVTTCYYISFQCSSWFAFHITNILNEVTMTSLRTTLRYPNVVAAFVALG